MQGHLFYICFTLLAAPLAAALGPCTW